ncbi:uncharacterized protein METZ01_LOCUS384422 [marine metagenome]|uniref:Uncharacterized protein n=1 Tax=marine metagenome TaxID=408172 RepID=A0A382UD03_9ZZZZ
MDGNTIVGLIGLLIFALVIGVGMTRLRCIVLVLSRFLTS